MAAAPGKPEAEVEILYSAARIAARVAALAEEIARHLGPEPMVVAILKGSFVFTADLLRALYHHGAHPQVEFLTLSSYGAGTASTGEIAILRDVTDDLSGRDVLLVDDILESGRTLAFARDHLRGLGAAAVTTCVLLHKPGKLEAEVQAEFVGFETPDLFVVGYGLDYAHYYRELPYIGVLKHG